MATTVSRERLNQIATRKLASLGIAARLSSDGQTLEGELAFSQLVHPATGTPIPFAGFQVVGHDRFQFTDAPLAALPHLVFFDLNAPAEIEERLAVALRVRMGFLQNLAGRFQALQLTPGLDPDRLVLIVPVQTVTDTFELVGSPEGVRVGRVAPRHGQPFPVSAELPPLQLEQYATLTDLELSLTDARPSMKPATAAPPAAAAKPAPPVLRSLPPAAGALCAGSLARFGAEAVVGIVGGRLEITQELELNGTRFRFAASHVNGSVFHGRLLGPAGERWSDKFALSRFPGIHELAALVLEVRATEPAPAEAEQPSAIEEVPQHLAPQAGEVWVMNVLVEREDAAEIRYTCVDVNGRPYGAPRVLARGDFERVCAHYSGGWRLRIFIDQVQGHTVVYRQLDPQGQPVTEPRSLRMDSFVTSFVPEAGAY